MNLKISKLTKEPVKLRAPKECPKCKKIHTHVPVGSPYGHEVMSVYWIACPCGDTLTELMEDRSAA